MRLTGAPGRDHGLPLNISNMVLKTTFNPCLEQRTTGRPGGLMVGPEEDGEETAQCRLVSSIWFLYHLQFRGLLLWGWTAYRRLTFSFMSSSFGLSSWAILLSPMASFFFCKAYSVSAFFLAKGLSAFLSSASSFILASCSLSSL